MPVSRSTVLLSEVLEVRGQPLTEPELWSVLCQTGEALQDLFLTGQSYQHYGPSFVLNPSSLMLTHSGRIQFTESVQRPSNEVYIAPEFYHYHGKVASDTAVEKMFVYGLGKTLHFSADYGLQNKPAILSKHLSSLMRALCDKDPADRIALVHILEACAIYAQKHTKRVSYSHYVGQMHKSVLGTSEEIKSARLENQYVSRHRNQRDLALRSPYRRSRDSRSRNEDRPRSRSRSRSPGRQRDKRNTLDSGYSPGIDESYDRSFEHPTLSKYVRNDDVPVASYGEQVQISVNHQLLLKKYPHLSSHTRQQPYTSMSPYQLLPGSNPSRHPQDPRTTQRVNGSPAYEKYLKLKERQMKLRALRVDLGLQESGSDMPAILPPFESAMLDGSMFIPSLKPLPHDCTMSSEISLQQGSFHPESFRHQPVTRIPMRGHDSDRDRDSVISSDMSAHPPDSLTTRASPQNLDQSQSHQTAQAKSEADGAASNVPAPTGKTVEKQREFYGPEFVYKAAKPLTRFHMSPVVGSRSPTGTCRIVVVLLTGQKLETMGDPQSTGAQLLEDVISHVNLKDHIYYGLTYINDGEHFFIDPDVKLHKIAPDGWKEAGKGQPSVITFTVYLRLKYYVNDLHRLRSDVSCHLLYLQLRRDLLEERVYINPDTTLALAGLALQAEYGDYSHSVMGTNYFMLDHYIPSRFVRAMGTASLRDKATVIHREATGLSATQTERQFIKLMMSLPEYGVHFYKLYRSKNDTNIIVWVGIAGKYLILSELAGTIRLISHKFLWTGIQKISFNKRRFSILPKNDYGTSKPHKLNYYTNSYKKGKYLLQLSTSQHMFQLRYKNAPIYANSADSVEMTSPPLDLSHLHEGDSGNFEPMEDEPLSDASAYAESVDVTSEKGSSVLTYSRSNASQAEPLKYREPPPPYDVRVNLSMNDIRPPPYKSGLSLSMEDIQPSAWQPVQQWRSTSDLSFSSSNVIEDDLHSIAFEPDMHGNKSSNGDEFHNRDMSPPRNETEESHSLECPSRCVIEVTLKKKPKIGIGLSIVGGEKTNRLDLGIFVKSVYPGGPASKDGRLKSGDRIIAINGQSLEGIKHSVAVKLIKEASDEVRLLVTQMKLKSIKKRISPHAEADSIFGPHAISTSPNKYEARTFEDLKQMLMDSKDNREQFIPLSCSLHSSDIYSSSDNEKNGELLWNGHYKDSANGSVSMDSPNYGILGDRESSTDSDFDSAIQAAIEGKTRTRRHGVRVPPRRAVTGPVSIEKSSSRRGKYNLVKRLEVYLEKENGAFGLHITGGANTNARDGFVFVKLLVPGGAAELEGTIRRGDRLLEIDSHDLEGATHSEVVAMLRSAPAICLVVIERNIAPKSVRKQSSSSSSSARMRRVSHGAVRPHLNGLDNRPLEVNLIRENLSSGILSFDDDVSESHRSFVNEGRFRTHNGVKKHKEKDVAPEEIKNKRPAKPRRQTLPSLLTTEPQPTSAYKKDSFTVTLIKDGQGLGLNVVTWQPTLPHVPNDKYVRISRLHPDGPGASCDQIEAGDVILKVNGSDDVSTEEQFWRLVASASETVLLVLWRPDPKIFSPLPKTSSNSELNLFRVPICNIDDLVNGHSSDIKPIKSKTINNKTRLSTGQPSLLRQSPINLSSSESDDENQVYKKGRRNAVRNKRRSTASFSSNGDKEKKDVLNSSEKRNSFMKKEDKFDGFRGKTDRSPTDGGNPQYQEIEVTLFKGQEKALGFTVAGSGDCFIKAIVHDPALTDGQLKAGDRLIMVNDQTMVGLSHYEAVRLMRNMPPEVNIVVHRALKPQLDDKSSEKSKMMVEVASPQVSHKYSDLLVSAKEPSSDPKSIHEIIDALEDSKTLIQPYDYSGQSQDKGQDEPGTIKPIKPDPPRNEMARSESDRHTKSSVSTAENAVFKVQLNKPASGGLGFSLVTMETNKQMGVFVKTLTVDGVAAQQSRIQVGDRLLQVNGESIIGMNHKKAISILRSAKDTVLLTLSRPQARVDNPVDLSNRAVESAIPISSVKKPAAYDIEDLMLLQIRASESEADLESLTRGAIEYLDSVISPDMNSETDDSKPKKSNKRSVTNDEADMYKRHLSVYNFPDDEFSETMSDIDLTDREHSDNEVLDKHEIDVPDTITDQWLQSLPILTVPDSEEYLLDLVTSLHERLEMGDPMEEYKSLRQAKVKQDCEVANHPDNKHKNRYRNVLPYDSNRVVLSSPDEYINASHVETRVGREVYNYVACQGPLPHTSDAFWRMIWEQNTQVIAMLTLDVEVMKVKCHRYWPESVDVPLRFCDRFTISLVDLQSVDNFDLRYLLMTDDVSGEEHYIVHANYTQWPDYGVPETALPLLQYLRLVQILNASSPLVIHCSAGIGRTGTVITIASALAHIEQQLKFDINDIVKELRRQRQGMVQTSDQYLFCYTACLEALQTLNVALPDD